MSQTLKRRAYYLLKDKAARIWYGPFRRPAELVSSYARFGLWLKTHPCENHFSERNGLFDYINDQLLNDSPIDYLEFGVFQGESIRYFSGINTSPKSRFIGFDSFEGLPEAWKSHFGVTAKGAFDSNGQPPRIEDERVSFVKGLFQQTLPGFISEFELRNRLVIHLDADLYTSTLYVLCMLNSLILKDTIIIFDEFSSLLHEFRALEDYAASFLREYRLVGYTDRCHEQVAIQILDGSQLSLDRHCTFTKLPPPLQE